MPASQALKLETNVAVPMRDGTILYADIYRQRAQGHTCLAATDTLPIRPCPSRCTCWTPLKAAKRGYAVVIQDTRGRYTSEGEFYAFRDDIHDGYDTVEWAASQPWSLGKVGMYGNSYVGATQWLAAIAPESRPPTTTKGGPYQGGAFALGFNVSWTLANLTLANFQSLAARKSRSRQSAGAAGPGG